MVLTLIWTVLRRCMFFQRIKAFPFIILWKKCSRRCILQIIAVILWKNVVTLFVLQILAVIIWIIIPQASFFQRLHR